MKTALTKIATGIGILILTAGFYQGNAQTAAATPATEKKTIILGLQAWTPENLNVTEFRNGDKIPEAATEEEWIKAAAEGKPAWCFYNNDPENELKYGRLYNWYAISDKRGLAPEGWRIPTSADWMTLVKNLLGVDVAGIKLKSTSGWKSKSGSNTIGFSALPGGFRNGKGAFKEISTKGQWWTSSEPVSVKPTNHIISMMLNDFNVEVGYQEVTKDTGLSVRCVKDIVRDSSGKIISGK